MPEIEIRREPQERKVQVELWADGEKASGLVVHDMLMRVGDVPVRCGGIGGVHTSAQHRMKGYARQTIDDALAYMREEGFQLAALFGIPDFYGQFGFAPALVRSEWSVLTRYAEAARPRYAVREFIPEDVPAVLALYEARSGDRSGSIVRNPATWNGFRLGAGWTSRVSAYVITTSGGQVVAYASYNLDPHRFAIGEVGWREADGALFETVLAEAAHRAVDLRLERIAFHGPVDDAFARYCRRYGAEVKVEYQRSGGGMARIVDQTSLLERVAPLLRCRLELANAASRPGSLVVKTELGTDPVDVGAGSQELGIELPQSVLTQLLLGYRDIDDAQTEEGVCIAEGALPAIRALFPAGQPYLWANDHF